MKQHKWHKEIKAWADGAEIEQWYGDRWEKVNYNHDWNENYEYRIKPQKTEPLIIPEEPVAVVYSMQDGYVGQMIKKGLPHKTLLYAHQDKPQPKEPQYYYVWQNHKGEVLFHLGDRVKETPIEYKYIGKIKLEGEEDV